MLNRGFASSVYFFLVDLYNKQTIMIYTIKISETEDGLRLVEIKDERDKDGLKVVTEFPFSESIHTQLEHMFKTLNKYGTY